VSSSLAFAALLSVGSVGGSLLAIATVDRIGRKPGIVAASVVGMIAAALFPHAADLTQSVISGMIMSAAIYYLLSVVFYVYQGEIFPTVFRQRGVGLGIASGRVILVLSPYLIVPLYGLGGTQAVFSLVSGLLLVTLLVIVTIGIETRGRSLEAISAGVGQATERGDGQADHDVMAATRTSIVVSLHGDRPLIFRQPGHWPARTKQDL
jgi:putative MFS transporter